MALVVLAFVFAPRAGRATAYGVSGTLTPASVGAGAIVVVSGAPGGFAIADSAGAWSLDALPPGRYTVTPRRSATTFTPVAREIVIDADDVPHVDFDAVASPPGPSDLPNLSIVVPPAAFAIAGSGAARVLEYTHLTFNGGPGPLLVRPTYEPSSGTYLGVQRIVRWSGDGWTDAGQVPVAGAFLFHAEHGHFHFPFAAFGLYADDGGAPGAPVDPGHKVGFCIADSYLLDPWLPHAALVPLGSCSDPMSLRGLSVGGADEYNHTDDGQSIPLAGVPDGTYWLRAVADPDGYFEQADDTDDETDVRLAIAADSVRVLETRVPVLAPRPSVAVAAPADHASVRDVVTVSATTSTTGDVRFLLDGAVEASGPPAWAWDTRTAANGDHWLAAQVTDEHGRIGTSAVVRVTVANPDTAPPIVSLTEPEAGATVSAIVTLGASIASPSTIAAVRFTVDGEPLGAPLASAPYLTSWKTLAFADGTHVLAVEATDAGGRTGRSPDVTVTVDNSHPPDTIVRDTIVVADGPPPLATRLLPPVGDYIVAFVAFDGPAGAEQSATVGGDGLDWTRLERANIGPGTAEVWVARATAARADATVTATAAIGGYNGSLTVIAFAKVAGAGVVGRAGAPSGAPDVYVPGVAAGSWVHAVGIDPAHAIARVPVPGQELVHQALDPEGGATAWVQAPVAPAEAFALVDVHDSFPVADPWNFAAIEVVATRCTCDTGTEATPQAALDVSPASGPAPLTVEFSAARSHSPGGDSLAFAWEFGDLQVAGGRVARHTYVAPGTYAARLAVRDTHGRLGVATTTITVTGPGDAIAELSPVVPNPARAGIHIQLALHTTRAVHWSVHDIGGRELWSGPARTYEPGTWTLDWNGRTLLGVADAGVYFARVVVGGRTFVRRFAIVK